MIELIDTFDAFDFDELASFQRLAFGGLRFNPERARLQRPQYYRWKYSPPAGFATLATIRCDGALAATAAAVPFVLAADEYRARAWQVCDIATHPRFRNRGFSSRCLLALAAALTGEMMFCFPNARSRPGLKRAGFRPQSAVQIDLMPIFPTLRGQWRQRDSNYIGANESGVTQLESRLHAERSLEFLGWRYQSHPLTHYACLPVDRPAKSHGFVVVRHIGIRGLRLGLVMELWPLSAAGMRAGIDVARQWARQTGCFSLLASRSVLSSVSHWRLPVSNRVIVTMGRVTPSQSESSAALLVQIGDWDAL